MFEPDECVVEQKLELQAAASDSFLAIYGKDD